MQQKALPLRKGRARATLEGRIVGSHRLTYPGDKTPTCRFELDVEGDEFVVLAENDLAKTVAGYETGSFIEVSGQLVRLKWKPRKAPERVEVQLLAEKVDYVE